MVVKTKFSWQPQLIPDFRFGGRSEIQRLTNGLAVLVWGYVLLAFSASGNFRNDPHNNGDDHDNQNNARPNSCFKNIAYKLTTC